MSCDHCGAHDPSGGPFCSHCGTLRARTAPAAPSETSPARFDRIAASDELRAARRHVPRVSTLAEVAMPAVLTVFGVGFLLFAGGSVLDSHASAGFMVMYLGVAVAFVVIAARMTLRGLRFRAAPIEQRLAVVVDERTQVSGGGDDRRATTRYYATLQDRDGRRTELTTYGRIAGQIARGDIGLAFVKGDRLVDFVRVAG